MNNLSYSTLIGWDTRSVKRHNKVISDCKDYGLKPILKTLYVGKLSTKEKKSIHLKMKKNLNKKTDKIFCGSFCESCLNELDSTVKEQLSELPSFKIIR